MQYVAMSIRVTIQRLLAIGKRIALVLVPANKQDQLEPQHQSL